VDANGHLVPEALLAELKKALRHGCRSARLLRYAPTLIQMLTPSLESPLLERALLAELLLREVCASYAGDWGEAMATLFGLAPGTHGTLLTDRRRQAGLALGMPADTFRRHWEHEILWDAAVSLIEAISAKGD
jgi:hypothetical protein